MRRLALLALLFACGKDVAGNADPGVTSIATVTLTNGGPQPGQIDILAGGQLTIANQDSAPHQLTSADCPDLQFQRLEAGAAQTFEVHDGPRSCTYTDTLGAKWSGQIHIIARPRTDGGGGY